jgi:hypothetical protein
MNKNDPDSRMMRTQGQPTVPGYNAQAAVTRGQIIQFQAVGACWSLQVPG